MKTPFHDRSLVRVRARNGRQVPSAWSHGLSLAIVCLAVLLLPACKSAAPPPIANEITAKALPETTEIPAGFKATDFVDNGAVDDSWLTTFDDPLLEDLVDEALRNNLNLRVAAAQVDSAAASTTIAGARLKPTVDLGLGATGSGTTAQSISDAGLGLSTTWEIDIWGKHASGAAAAEASFAAAQANYEFARQSLAAQTAKAWFIAIQTRLLFDLGLETIDLYRQTLELVDVKLEVGQVTRQDLSLAKADLASAQEAHRQAEAADRQARRSLELLLGRYPAAEIEAHSELPPLPPPVPVGLPSDLLERRPDLIAAENNVAAAFFLTEQAEAAKLPSFAITAGVGASSDVGDLIFNLGAGMFAPLFRGGALEAQVEQADALQRAAIASYGQAVLKAFEEVEAALTSESLSGERESYLTVVLDENTEAWELAKAQYEVGKIDLLSVLQMQARVVGARIGLVNIRSERMIDRINLHLALGGGFEEDPEKRVVEPTTAE